MSLETRTTSAINKRAEQLRQWQESETNREPATPKSKSLRRIQFPPGCVFLAACAATDKDEVQLLLDHGADINTTNVDGLTALHQACIDNNLDMVEFLVTNGANINQGDNEGWTPLHTTASCGFTSIVRYLLDNGADISAVNNEGDLAYDICFTSEEMDQLLETEMKIRGINDKEARSKEERLMLEDVKSFLKFNDNHNILTVHPKTGATSLHVAASKGYLKVLDQLLKSNRLDIDKQDFDGWTPLHAAAYWGQSEACEMLIKQHHADMEIKTYLNQTIFDIAKEPLLDDLNKWDREQDKAEVQRRKLERKRFEAKMRPVEQSINQLPPTKVKKISNYDDDKRTSIEANCADSDNDNFAEKENIDINSKSSVTNPNSNANVEMLDVPSNSNNVTETASDVKEFINSPLPRVIRPNDSFANSNTYSNGSENGSNGSEDRTQASLLQSPVHQRQRVPWKRPDSLSNRVLNDSKIKAAGDTNVDTLKSDQSLIRPSLTDSDVSLRRTQSFESDKKFYLRYLELHARIKASSHPVIVSPPSVATTTSTKTSTVPERLSLTSTSATTTTNIINSSSSAIPNIPPPPPSPNIINNNNTSILSTNYNSCATTTESASSTTITSSTNVYRFGVSDSKSNFSNTSDVKPDVVASQPIVKRSFVPPVRDEESETQRKAHAKRVRETRRSTQGVTLDEIKSAEELIKKQQQQQQQQQLVDETNNNVSVSVSIPANQPTNSKNSDESTVVQDRRPSWRLRVDNGSKFALEDASKEPSPTYSLTSPFNRRHSSLLSSTNNRPVVTPATSTTNTTVASNSLESTWKHDNDTDSVAEKEVTTTSGSVNNSNGATTLTNTSVNLASQAVIQRRRRPKRRSTGVVSVDLDEIINSENVTENGQLDDKKESDDDRNKENSTKSCDNEPKPIKKATENGEIAIDYKKLWEEAQLENGVLKDKLRKAEGELREAKEVLDRINSVTSKNSLSLSELEKREKRAMERKLSEMEEELKQLQKLKAENERLRTENKALTRVVNKLSNSTIK